jgi:hypothetical protein
MFSVDERLVSIVISWPGVVGVADDEDVMMRYLPAGISAMRKLPFESDVVETL